MIIPHTKNGFVNLTTILEFLQIHANYTGQQIKTIFFCNKKLIPDFVRYKVI